MRRADRLFRIVEYLKARRRPVTAERLARAFEVSTRTIYRDVADLDLSGVPIVGEAGVGYTLDRDYVLRPLMFDLDELEALALGARMVASWSDDALADAARRAADKIASVVPEALRREIADATTFSLPSRAKPRLSIDFTALRRAIRAKNMVGFAYRKDGGEPSTRLVHPLGLLFFGPVWLLLGWCESREDFRNFRLDRMRDLVVKEERFRDEKGKRLRDYGEYERMSAREGAREAAAGVD